MNNDNLLAKWLSGEITEEEFKVLEKTEDLSSYRKIVAHVDRLETPAFDQEALLHKIRQAEDKHHSGVIVPLWWKKVLQAAAVVAVLLGSYLFLSHRDTVIATANAEKNQILLPDQSEVILNAASRLTYNNRKWDRKRLVKLEGEAFFKVAPGNTFDVVASPGIVSVLGTQFNVKNRADYFEVSCYEGAVRVAYEKDTLTLAPGNTFRVLSGKTIKADYFTDVEPSWLHYETTFKSVPYSQVVEEFERQYDVKIRLRTDIRNNYTGSFTNKDIETALKSITLPFRLKYEFTDGQKDQITIYADKD